MSKQTLFGLLGTFVIVVGVGIFIFILFRSTLKEAEVIFYDTYFEVTGQYGNTYLYDEMVKVELKDSIPDDIKKTNGAALKDVKKGDFTVDGYGDCKLYVHKNEGPFIYIEMTDYYIIMNFYEQDTTDQIYQDLLSHINTD